MTIGFSVTLLPAFLRFFRWLRSFLRSTPGLAPVELSFLHDNMRPGEVDNGAVLALSAEKRERRKRRNQMARVSRRINRRNSK
jgi:hypothetical protein